MPDASLARYFGLKLVLLVLALSMPAPALAEEEYALKAAFLFHFLNFVTWPDDVFETPTDPFRVCLVGADPFGDVLKPITRKKAQGRPIRLLHATEVSKPNDCQVVFISVAQREELRKRLDAWSARGVLTVGDARGFSELGGVIGYVMVGNRVRFVLNDEAAERASLMVSVKLRKVAIRR